MVIADREILRSFGRNKQACSVASYDHETALIEFPGAVEVPAWDAAITMYMPARIGPGAR